MTSPLPTRVRAVLAAGTPRPRSLGALAWAVLAIAVVLLFALAVPLTATRYGAGLPTVFLAFTLLCASILTSPRFPKASVAVHIVGLLTLALATYSSGNRFWPLPVSGLIAFCLLLTVLGLGGNWVLAIVTWWLAILLLLAIVVVTPGGDAAHDWSDTMIVGTAVSTLVLGVSIAIGQRAQIRRELLDARRDVELEHARREHVEERARIAREMHDVVVHSMSLVHMQASSAPYRLTRLDDATRAEFANIATAARAALGEMRDVLGVLRPDVSDAPRAPQPQLADLRELVAATSRTGCPVSLTVSAGVETLSAVLQLTAYRITQEALSNVLRHSPGASATVALTLTAGELSIDVTNGPGSPDTADRPRAEGRRFGGRGIPGMQERVEQFGGRIEYGPTPAGGYRLHAVLPARERAGATAEAGAGAVVVARAAAGTASEQAVAL